MTHCPACSSGLFDNVKVLSQNVAGFAEGLASKLNDIIESLPTPREMLDMARQMVEDWLNDRLCLVPSSGSGINSGAIGPACTVVVLVGGEMPFEIEGPLEVPAGRDLTIIGNRSESGEARVKVNVREDFKVSGTLNLIGLEISRASVGEQSDNYTVDVPLVEVFDGGTAEIIQTELRVKVGGAAIAIKKGSLVLSDVIIAGELPTSMEVTLMLVASKSGDFTSADHAGLVQAIASLADVPPAAVALTL